MLLKKKQKQEITVENINLNGIDLKIKEFGEFYSRDNPFVENKNLKTCQLSLNGEWNLKLLKQKLVGKINSDRMQTTRDKLENCDIACFGCSMTYGAFLNHEQSWPYQLGMKTNFKVRNYGIRGSTIYEMIAFVDYYLQKYEAKYLIMLIPHTMRTQNELGQTVMPTENANREYLFHGEKHSVANLSVPLNLWLNNIKKTKVFFSTYHKSEYDLFQKTPINKWMLPFLDYHSYPLASDNQHFGSEYNKEFADIIVNHITRY